MSRTTFNLVEHAYNSSKGTVRRGNFKELRGVHLAKVKLVGFWLRTWDIQGSNNDSDWTTIHTVTDKPPSIYGDVHTISSPGSYQYYRLAWIANNTSRETTCIAELIYYGDA